MFGFFKKKKKPTSNSPNEGKGLPSTTIKVPMPKVEPPKRDPNPNNTSRPSHFADTDDYNRRIQQNNDDMMLMTTLIAAGSVVDDDTTRNATSSYCDTSSSYSSYDSGSSSSFSDSSSSSSCD